MYIVKTKHSYMGGVKKAENVCNNVGPPDNASVFSRSFQIPVLRCKPITADILTVKYGHEMIPPENNISEK